MYELKTDVWFVHPHYLSNLDQQVQDIEKLQIHGIVYARRIGKLDNGILCV